MLFGNQWKNQNILFLCINLAIVYCLEKQTSKDPDLPASVHTVTSFISYLFVSGFSASRISSHLSAVAYYHQIQHYPNPTDPFFIRRMTLGCKKNRQNKDSNLPLLLTQIHILTDACISVHQGYYDIILYPAILLFLIHVFSEPEK
jgi:hypothetical protein